MCVNLISHKLVYMNILQFKLLCDAAKQQKLLHGSFQSQKKTLGLLLDPT